MQRFTITLDILQYWHCGTGSGGEGDVDATPVTEASGLPYVPGKHLKGLLREAARFAVAEGFIVGDDILVERWFGGRGNLDGEKEGLIRVASAMMPGSEEFAVAARKAFGETGLKLPELPALFETLRQTALEDGVAINRSLRSTLTSVPMKLEGEIELEISKEVEPDAAEKLGILCKLLRAVGHGRNDGLGRCIVSCKGSEEINHAKSAAQPQEKSSMLVELTLTDDVIVSASAASAGGHDCLDHIPGSALLGIAAGKCYKSLKKSEQATEVFQAGGISFGCAYPVADGQQNTSLPVPASWHEGKDRPTEQPKDLSGNPEAWDGVQPKQMRSGYLATDRLMNVTGGYLMKTAVDPATGTAEEAKLFGFSYIPAGTRFIARIEAKDSGLLDLVAPAFDNRQVRIGRSRNTEFGRAHARILPDTSAVENYQAAKQFSIYAESDLQLLDGNGFPASSPTAIAVALGLEKWTVDMGRSFIRYRSYSKWNAFRKRFDPERQVIAKGSVITLTGDDPFTPQSNRVGAGLADGLGRIHWCVPEIPKVHNSDASSHQKSKLQISLDPENPFARRYLRTRHDREALALGREWSTAWLGFRASLGSSQWSRLRAQATKAKTATALAKTLMEDGAGMFVHGGSAKKWQKEKGRNNTLSGEIIKCLGAATGENDFHLAACREAARLCAAAKAKENIQQPL